MKGKVAPKDVVRKFVSRRALKSSIILGAVIALYMLAKASSYLTTYSTEAARQKIAEALGSNVGIEALLGVAHHIDTVSGYVAWNFLCLVAAVGAIWAFLLTTKILRGEEDAGRWEIMLAGQTTARNATADALMGLGRGLVIVYVLFALGISAISRLHGADFSFTSSLFFALALVAGAAEFLAVGALASQLMPVRSRALGLSASVFGVCYAIRLIADTTSAHWLLVVSPLGWIEKLQPMYNSQPIWLLPIASFVFVLCALTIYLSGKRDLGEGILANKDTAKPHSMLLKTPSRFALRASRLSITGWLSAIGIGALVYGQLAKGAVVNSLSNSAAASKALNRLSQTSQVQTVSTETFLGLAFFLIMIVAMFYAASAVGRLREDEAEGYLDNFLVRPLSRTRWMGGRVILILSVILAAGLLSALSTWAGQATQHDGVSFHSLLVASANGMVPVILVLGIGIFVLGLMPRLTSVLTYGAIAWSFLLVMLSSGLNINHWLLDTSILHHVALSPAVSANWTSNLVLISVAAILGFIGFVSFNSRDLEGE